MGAMEGHGDTRRMILAFVHGDQEDAGKNLDFSRCSCRRRDPGKIAFVFVSSGL